MPSTLDKVKSFFSSIGHKVIRTLSNIKTRIAGVFGKAARKHTRRAKKVAVPAPAPASVPVPVPVPAPVPAPIVAGPVAGSPTQTAGRKLRAANMRRMKFYKPKATRKSR